MQWAELCKKAKDMGYRHNEATVWNGRYYYTGEVLSLNGIYFTKEDGVLFVDGPCIIAYDRKPKQMYQIMEALR